MGGGKEQRKGDLPRGGVNWRGSERTCLERIAWFARGEESGEKR